MDNRTISNKLSTIIVVLSKEIDSYVRCLVLDDYSIGPRELVGSIDMWTVTWFEKNLFTVKRIL